MIVITRAGRVQLAGAAAEERMAASVDVPPPGFVAKERIAAAGRVVAARTDAEECVAIAGRVVETSRRSGAGSRLLVLDLAAFSLGRGDDLAVEV
jgi:hypothetical protein